MHDGRFYFRAAVEPASVENEGMRFRSLAATDELVQGWDGRSKLTFSALAQMKALESVPITAGTTHEGAVLDPVSIVGDGVPVLDAERGQFVVDCELDPDHPYAKSLWRQISKHPERIKVSIGGFIPEGGASYALDEESGVQYQEISALDLDHVLVCRAGTAVDQSTWVEARTAESFGEAVFRAAHEVLEGRAKWSAAYVNDLPDSAFLYIEPGGEKDEDGKTVPRSLRKLPVKDAEGNYDCPHLANAAARANQVKLSDGSTISESLAEELKNKAQNLYQEHCTEGRCESPTETLMQAEVESPMDTDREEAMSLLQRVAHAIHSLLGRMEPQPAEPEEGLDMADELEVTTEEEQATPEPDPMAALVAQVAELTSKIAKMEQRAQEPEVVAKPEPEPEAWRGPVEATQAGVATLLQTIESLKTEIQSLSESVGHGRSAQPPLAEEPADEQPENRTTNVATLLRDITRAKGIWVS